LYPVALKNPGGASASKSAEKRFRKKNPRKAEPIHGNRQDIICGSLIFIDNITAGTSTQLILLLPDRYRECIS